MKINDKVYYMIGRPRNLDTTMFGKIMGVLPNNKYLFKQDGDSDIFQVDGNLLRLESEKGVEGKNCNRTACQESPANLKHNGNGKFYCWDCAIRIHHAGNESYDFFNLIKGNS